MSSAAYRNVVFALALVALVGVAREARGQSATDTAGAEALFKLGREALDQGRVHEACDRFHESYRLDPAGGTLLNIGTCEERRGHLAAAWEAFSEAAAKLSVGDPRTTRARERIAALDRRLPRLVVVRSPEAPVETRVFRDQIELQAASFGVALPLDAGLHRLRVVAPDHVDREIDVRLEEGESARIVAEPGPLASVPVVRLDRTVDSPKSSAPKGAASTVAFLAGGVLTLAGVTFGALTYEAGQRVDEHCDAAGACSMAGMDAVRDARRWGTFSTVAFVSAGLSLTAGLVIYLLHPSSSPGRHSAVQSR